MDSIAWSVRVFVGDEGIDHVWTCAYDEGLGRGGISVWREESEDDSEGGCCGVGMRRKDSCAAGSVAEVPVVLFDRIGGVVGYAARGVEEDCLTNVGVGWVEGVVGDRLEEDKLAGGVCQILRCLGL